MTIEKVDFYYFSGTGNTLLVVEKMEETFKKNGVDVELHKIEDSDPLKINLEHTIGIAFPVVILSTYHFVSDFIHSLPPTNGTKIFMVDTLGGVSGGIVGPLREIVKKKGYNPIGAKEIQMPLNIFYVEDEKTNQKKVQKGLNEAHKYALTILNGESEWGRVPVLSDAINLISRGALKLADADFHQKLFIFDPEPEKCRKCGICVELCPVGNIQMVDDEYPKHGLNCEYCLRCVSLCPRQAMPARFNYKGKTYRAVKAKEIMH